MGDQKAVLSAPMPKSVKRKNAEKVSQKILNLDPQLFLKYTDEHKHSKQLLLKDSTQIGNWTEQLISEAPEETPVPFSIRKKLKELARDIYQNQINMYGLMQANKPQTAKDRSVQSGATKNILLSLLDQCYKYPIYTLQSFHKLINHVSPKKKHDVKKAFSYIRSLLEAVYLPNGHVPKEFACHGFKSLLPYLDTSKDIVEKHLLLWYFEDQFILAYKLLIDNLNELTNEAIYKIKYSAIQDLSKLAVAYPYLEPELILSKLINKLGDPNFTVAGSSVNLIRTLTFDCPQHKCLVVALLDEFLHRPNLADKSKYYGLCLLKDIKFGKNDSDLAMKIIRMYTKFFSSFKRKGDIDNRFMSCLLTGMNRAYPYIDESQTTELQMEISTLYKMTHEVNFKTAFKAMSLIYLVMTHSSTISDRFYQLLYTQILSAVSCNYPLKNNVLKLIYHSLREDPQLPRLKSFVKRLLQMSLLIGSEYTCGILIILSNVVKEHVGLQASTKILWEVMPHNVAYNLEPPKKEKDWIKEEKTIECRTTEYDPTQRNPLFTGANLTQIYELLLLKNHFHPFVQTAATRFMSNKFVECKGDPLEIFSVKHFLERTINKKPKQKKPTENVFTSKSHKMTKNGAAYDPEKLKLLDEKKVSPENLFIHQYFTKCHRTKNMHSQDDVKFNDDDDLFEQVLKEKNFSEYLPDLDKGINFAATATRSDTHQPEDMAESDDEDKLDDVQFNEAEMEELDAGNEEVLEFSDDDSDDDNFDEELEQINQEDLSIPDSDDGGSIFEEDFEPTPKKTKKRKLSESSDEQGIFGDQFTEMLEEVEDCDGMLGTSEALINRDKSSKQQIAWESKKLAGDSKEHSIKRRKVQTKSFKKKSAKKRK